MAQDAIDVAAADLHIVMSPPSSPPCRQRIPIFDKGIHLVNTSAKTPAARKRLILALNVIVIMTGLIFAMSLNSSSIRSMASSDASPDYAGPKATERVSRSGAGLSRWRMAGSLQAVPTLGNYPSTMVALSGNTTATPDAAPTNTTSTAAETTADFKGELEASPLTGIVRITNAHPAGTFTVTVTSYDPGGTGAITRTFALTVIAQSTCDTFGTTSFSAPVNSTVGTAPFSVAVGDFNGDGEQDLVTANQTTNNVSVLQRNATNTGFDPKVDFPVGIAPVSVAIGDFNGDGKEDIVAANNTSNTVSVLLRNVANTGFDPKLDSTVAGTPRSVAVGDFNGDGKQDLAIACLGGAGSPVVSVLLRNAANTGFDPKVDYPAASGPFSVAVGDFNGDGKQDIGVSNIIGNSVSIFLRNAANTSFDPKIDYPAGNFAVSLAVGDFNGDGKPDLLTANRNDNTVSVLLRNAANNGFDGKVDFPSGTTPASVAAGDFNFDGKQDIAVVNNASNNVSVLVRNAANTGFDARIDFAVGATPTFVRVGDFNADGKQDLVAVNNGANNVSVLQRQCAPMITAAGPLTIQKGSSSVLQIAAVSDGDQSPNTLTVTATPLSGTGVTVTGITIDASGNVTATVAATCTATNSTFTLTVTDSTALTATATLIVNVTPETTPPTLTCPTDISNPADPGVCTAPAIFTTPAASDNCGAATVVCNPASGTTFMKGVTTVTCTATDTTGNMATCSFTVTITDTQPPTVTCPANVIQNEDPGVCTAVVTYTTPIAVDNCTGATVVCAPASGSTFAQGVTTVTCTATDAATLTGTCSFTVTINDTQSPTVKCPMNVTQNTDPGVCTAVVTYTTPTGSDNCTLPADAVVCSPASGTAFTKGTTTVTCTVTDAATLTGSCTFTVTVVDNEAPSVKCPLNITTSTDPNVCTSLVKYPTPQGNDNCKLPANPVVCVPASGSAFPKGPTTVTCTVTDAGNLTSMCTFLVTVNDTQPPAIACPANITQPTAPGQCSAVVTYANAVATDNCPGVGTPICSPPSGSTFPKGATTVTCGVSDASNNTSTCAFTVTVVDTQAPVLVCPSSITGVTNQGTCQQGGCQIVNFTTTATDNCPAVQVACVPPSGSCLPTGSSLVNCVATDSSGNKASCSFPVMVADGCIQDDSNPTTVLLLNSQTGAYRFCCNGATYSGVGTVTVRGCTITLQHNTMDRRISATIDKSVFKGTASIQTPPGTMKCTITDRDTRNNSCTCQ